MISDVYDSIVAAFKAYHCPAVVFLGAQYRDQHTSPMRVVMWPAGTDAFKPQNGSVLTDPQLRLWKPINPRSTATRGYAFLAELWATAPVQRRPGDQYRADLAYLDALVNQFAVVLQQLTSGIFTIQGGEAAESNAAAGVSGLGYTMAVQVDVPIIDARWPAQQLDACTKTWAEAPARAIISIDGKVDPEPPHYQTGEQFPVPTEES